MEEDRLRSAVVFGLACGVAAMVATWVSEESGLSHGWALVVVIGAVVGAALVTGWCLPRAPRRGTRR